MMRWLATMAGILLLCSCGMSTSTRTLPADYRGNPVSPATNDVPSPLPYVTPPLYDTPSDALSREMESDLLSQIGQGAVVTPECGNSLVFTGVTKTIRCTADWDGVAIPFNVTLEGNENPYFSVEVSQVEGLLVGTAVRQAWSQQNFGSTGALSCDRDLPDALVVPFNHPTRYRCAVGTEIDYVEIDDLGVAGAEIDFT